MTVKLEAETYPDTYFAGAYWGPRKESPEECARRTASFLNRLAECDPFLAHWYKPARSRKDARTHSLMPPDMPLLAEMFRRGVNRERGGPVFEDLGFSFWFDNGGTSRDCAALRIRCGGYAEAHSNSCFLSLPNQGPNAERIFTASVLAEVVRSMALAWEPEWVAAMSRMHRELDDKDGNADILLGWVTYLSRHRGTVPPLPAPVRIEPVGDQGTLIILTPERFTVSNPEHIALARRVRELLARAGLMSPGVS
ncbi:immunity 52 family protein [Corallococcus macrosporus]|uniref:Immunity 52 family protein n=1 Tax=Corallococcus macrosporus TaxID=35 RepID=A0ABS3DE91_9BACT|nr:immunity 52 family protein [Corallococcus macrosporus]MBN8229994.1 immunity 52 family protein [Corallococcus macrosporus]